jgi:phosphatidylserine decarboxylase
MLYAFPMSLTPYGWRVWLPILLVAAVLACVFAWFELWIPFAIIIILTLALLSFFRDPWRRIRTDLSSEIMLSPADGAVSAVLDVDSHEATGGTPAKIIRIFLSVLNVHINRAPCDCEVVSIKRSPGKYLNAQTEESAKVNESNLIVLKFDDGELFGVRQVAGMIARAIVCPLTPGSRLKRGQKFGMIKFGSTTELILPRPHDVTVHVKKGDKVKGGLTQIATLRAMAGDAKPQAAAESRAN